MDVKTTMTNLGQDRFSPATPYEEQQEKAPGVVFRMERGSNGPYDTPQEKRRQSTACKKEAENSKELSESKRIVCKRPRPSFQAGL